MSFIQIAIDGPAVSGKSSAAKQLARRMGYLYLDSGAVYRSITLATLRGFQIQAQDDLMSAMDGLEIKLVPNESGLGCRVLMHEEDVSEAIREQEVTDHILPISGNPEVREWVTDFLHEAAKSDNVVMDGRDIGSVVFPDSEFKFFVQASVEARADRRIKDLSKNDEGLTREEIMEAIEQRDEGDRSRKIGPLVHVEDAVLIDNSELDLVETVCKMVDVIEQKREGTWK